VRKFFLLVVFFPETNPLFLPFLEILFLSLFLSLSPQWRV